MSSISLTVQLHRTGIRGKMMPPVNLSLSFTKLGRAVDLQHSMWRRSRCFWRVDMCSSKKIEGATLVKTHIYVDKKVLIKMNQYLLLFKQPNLNVHVRGMWALCTEVLHLQLFYSSNFKWSLLSASHVGVIALTGTFSEWQKYSMETASFLLQLVSEFFSTITLSIPL